DLRYAVDASDGGNIPDEIVIEVLVERRVNHIVRADGEQRVAIRWRARHNLGRDIAAGAWPVFDDELLAESLGQPLTYDAGDDVDRLARGKSDHHADRPRGVGLRRSNARDSRERGTRGQIQKLSAGKFHLRPPVGHNMPPLHVPRAPVQAPPALPIGPRQQKASAWAIRALKDLSAAAK